MQNYHMPVTIPEALKPFGYVSAHIGKWHMRGDTGEEGNIQLLACVS